MAFYDGETTKNYLYVRFSVFYEIFRLVGRVSRIADISITLERGLTEVLVTSVIIVIADMIYVPFPITREIFNCRFRHGKLHQLNRLWIQHTKTSRIYRSETNDDWNR